LIKKRWLARKPFIPSKGPQLPSRVTSTLSRTVIPRTPRITARHVVTWRVIASRTLWDAGNTPRWNYQQINEFLGQGSDIVSRFYYGVRGWVSHETFATFAPFRNQFLAIIAFVAAQKFSTYLSTYSRRSLVIIDSSDLGDTSICALSRTDIRFPHWTPDVTSWCSVTSWWRLLVDASRWRRRLYQERVADTFSSWKGVACARERHDLFSSFSSAVSFICHKWLIEGVVYRVCNRAHVNSRECLPPAPYAHVYSQFETSGATHTRRVNIHIWYKLIPWYLWPRQEKNRKKKIYQFGESIVGKIWNIWHEFFIETYCTFTLEVTRLKKLSFPEKGKSYFSICQKIIG